MDRSLRWRTIALLLILVFSLLSLLPSFVDRKDLPAWYNKLFSQQMQLGLDLQGGLHIVYSIDLDKAVADKASEIRRDVESFIKQEGVAGTASTTDQAGAVIATVADPDQRQKVRDWLFSSYQGVIVEATCADSETNAVCVRVSADYAESIRKSALSQAVETIRSRVDEKGIAEPTVITKGDDIIVELPGLDKDFISKVKDIIARAAKLEFKAVIDDALDVSDPPDPKRDNYMARLFRHIRGTGDVPGDPEAARLKITVEVDGWRHDQTGNSYSDYFLRVPEKVEETVTVEEAKGDLNCWKEGESESFTGSDGVPMVTCEIPGHVRIERYLAALETRDDNGDGKPDFADLALRSDRQIGYELITPSSDAEVKESYWRTYYMDRAVRLTGTTITEAVTTFDPQTGRPEVLVSFNRSGTRTFGALTTELTGHKMAIILDDKVKSAPIIQTAITGGRSTITMGGGSPTEQLREAEVLVSVLKSGSLPAPLREQSSAVLGPTLGQDAIEKTELSFALGILAVIVLMIAIYRWAGLIANITVFINIALTLAAMSVFGATLTLPGIAAVVLTVGMTVDGNVLIYERIRDELLAGKSVKGAVDIGFARAFSAILDGQLTTGAAGWVLLQYGSGPIQGFATMLLVGIGTTLFVNTFCTRLLFDWYVLKNKGRETISI